MLRRLPRSTRTYTLFPDTTLVRAYVLKLGGKACEGLMDLWEQTYPGVEFMNWKETRKKAKAINFGYLYGMWWKKFKIYARDNYGVNVTDDEAQASREAFFELYPGFPKWHARQSRLDRKSTRL